MTLGTTVSKSPHILISGPESNKPNKFAQKLMFFSQEDQEAYKSCASLEINIEDWLPTKPNEQVTTSKFKPANLMAKAVEERSGSPTEFKLEKIPEA